jgi:phenylalanyl-tRNA synthetase beta chain
LFEIADVYLPCSEERLPRQPARVALVAGLDYFGIKGIVEALLDALHIPGELNAQLARSPLFTPGRAAELRLGDTRLGYAGEVSRERSEQHDLRVPCGAAELDLQVLIDHARLVPQACRLPLFPAVARDLSLVVDRSLPWATLAATVRSAAGPLLDSLEFLDTFDLPDEKHSLHFGLRFLHPERTLTGEEVERAVQAVVDASAANFGATLRA